MPHRLEVRNALATSKMREKPPPEWALEATEVSKSRTVVVSDETIIGGLHAASPRSGPYPQAGARIRRFLNLLRLSEVDANGRVALMIAVRHPADFLPSVWQEGLRFRPQPPYRRWLGPGPLDRPFWLGVIKRVRDSLPDAPLFVWTYEAYASDPMRFLPLAAGLPPSPPEDAVSVNERIRPRLSAPVVREIKRLHATGGVVSREVIEDLIAAHSAAGPSATPAFDADERKMLGKAYERDLAEISAIEGVTLYS